MYDVIESRSRIEPPEAEIVGCCAECGQDIFIGEDVWEVRGDRYCEDCIDSFRTEAERKVCYEDV